MKGEHFVVYSSTVPPGEFASLKASIALCPTYLQELIVKDHELRATIIGDELFCFRIDSQEVEGAEQDWRAVDTVKLPHRIVDLRQDVADALRAYLKRCGLRFGDLIVTPQGEHLFLQLSPNGQWYWIELATGAPDGRCDDQPARRTMLEGIGLGIRQDERKRRRAPRLVQMHRRVSS